MEIRHENHAARYAAIYAAAPHARGGDGAVNIDNVEIDEGTMSTVPGAA